MESGCGEYGRVSMGFSQQFWEWDMEMRWGVDGALREREQVIVGSLLCCGRALSGV